MIKALRKKYELKPDYIHRMRRPAGGNDVIMLCDVIDELEGLLRDIQHISPTDTQNIIERRLFAIMTAKKNP